MTSKVDVSSARAAADQHQPRQVELLLPQIAAFLNRSLQLRSEFFDLGTKDYLLELESRQFDAYDQIHRQETVVGYYTVDATESRGLAGAAASDKATLVAAMNSILDLIDSFSQTQTDANLGGVSAPLYILQAFYAQIEAAISHRDSSPFTVTLDYTDSSGAQGEITANTDVCDLAASAAIGQTYFRESVQQGNLNIQAKQTSGAAEAAEGRAFAADTRATYNEKMIQWRLDRTDVARGLAQEKKLARTAPGGPLNYGERMKSIQIRCASVVQEALSRLVAVQRGLGSVYGYTPPATVLSNADSPRTSPSYLDDLVLWTQNAQTFLSKFSQAEQSLILPISLQPYLGDLTYTRGLNNSNDSGGPLSGFWDFELREEDFFAGMSFVRLRGISIYPKFNAKPPTAPPVLLQGLVCLPKTTHYRYSATQTSGTIAQNVPPLRIGRLQPRDVQQQGDMFGAVSAFNASPFGKWRVIIARPQGSLDENGVMPKGKVSPGNQDTTYEAYLNDVVIDLSIAYKPLT